MADTDRELCELAAKAAGIRLEWEYVGPDDPDCAPGWYATDLDSGRIDWNPLTDDGDALRLMVALRLSVKNTEIRCSVMGPDSFDGGWLVVTEPHKDDPAAATRRAIVRAAAEIGKAML